MSTGAGRRTPERRRRGATLTSPRLRPPLEAGRLLAGRYRLERPLGRRGVVWLARSGDDDDGGGGGWGGGGDSGSGSGSGSGDSDSGRLWAVKTGPAVLLEQEHRILSRIAHPAIVRLRDFCDSEAGPILVLEYLAGGDLVGLAGGAPSRWLDPVLALIGALDCLHAAGLVHRDLKARNVMLDGGDRARLIDFGSALPIGSAWTSAGTTAAAVAPDRGAEPVAPADDVYALAALLHELIHGRPPGPWQPAAGRTAPVLSPSRSTANAPALAAAPTPANAPTALAALVDAGLGGRQMAARIGLAGFRTVIESQCQHFQRF